MISWIKRIKVYLFLFCICELLGVYMLFKFHVNRKEEYCAAKIQELNIAYRAIINNYGLITETIFSELIDKPEILSLLQRISLSDTSGQSKIREELYNLLVTTYQNLHRLNYIELHFLLPDNTSFLRFHKPSHFGDDLTGSRPSIVLANREKIPVEGFEIGREYHGYRYIYPLLSGTDHIGGIEIGISFPAIRREMERLFGIPFLFLIDKNIAVKNQFENEQGQFSESELSPEFLIEKEIVRSGTVAEILDSSAIEKINSELAQEINTSISKRGSAAIPGKITKRYIIVTLVPIQNRSGQHIAYLISYEYDQNLQKFHRIFLQELLILSFFLITLFFLIYYIIRHYKMVKNKRDQLDSVMNNITDGLLITDLENIVISLNPAAEKILRQYKHEVVGRKLDHIISHLDENGISIPVNEWSMFARMVIGLTYQSDQGFYIFRDKRKIPVEVIGTPRYQGAEMAGYLIVFRQKTTDE